jgi:lipoprotein NlpD
MAMSAWRARLDGLTALALAGFVSACVPPTARPPKLPAGKPLAGSWYTVKKGDTLAKIAEQKGVALQDVEEINDVDRRDRLAAGKTLFLPASKRRVLVARSVPAAGASRVARRPSKPALSSSTPLIRSKQRTAQSKPRPLLWPVSGGVLSSRFGKRGRQNHEGIDIAAPEGTAVKAAAAGRVIYAGNSLYGYGNMVIVRHAGKLVTVYAHNKRNLVQVGQPVLRGQVIAEVGHTGRTTGDHLHFEVRVGETPTDPLRYVKVPKKR